MLDSLIAMSVAAILAANNPPSTHSDYFEACVARDGKAYMVDANTSHCRAGDEATRCAMPDNKVVNTRGPDECNKRGGRPLGYPRNSN